MKQLDSRRLIAGVVPLVALGGIAVVGLGSFTWWQMSDYRIERTKGGLVCSVSKDVLADWGEQLQLKLGSLADACKALENRVSESCPTVDADTAALCGKYASNLAATSRSLLAAPWHKDQEAPSNAFQWMRATSERFAFDGSVCPSVEEPLALRVMRGNITHCLAFLTNSRTMVTAAHCLQESQGVAVTNTVDIIVVCNVNRPDERFKGTCSAAVDKKDWLGDCKQNSASGQKLSPDCYKDLASCTFKQDLPADCSTRYQAVVNEVVVRKLAEGHVVSRCPPLKKDVFAMTQQDWPLPGQGYAAANVQSLKIEPSDSGSPMAAMVDGKLSAVGVVINTNPGSSKLQAVPLYSFP